MTADQIDQHIGQRVRELREHVRRSQQSTAEAMREHGFPWRHTTVVAIEQGKRPLRLNEAERLCQMFGVDVNDLLRHTPMKPELALAIGELIKLHDQIERRIDRLINLHDQIEELDKLKDQIGRRLNQLSPVPFSTAYES